MIIKWRKKAVGEGEGAGEESSGIVLRIDHYAIKAGWAVSHKISQRHAFPSSRSPRTKYTRRTGKTVD